jgi:hypothetical protein
MKILQDITFTMKTTIGTTLLLLTAITAGRIA